jgi:molecular chaperone HscB
LEWFTVSLPELSLASDHFALLNVPQLQALDGVRLDANYHQLQGRVHPDRHLSASDADRRLAMQWASRVNEAFKTLRDPLSRANYLLKLKGHDTDLESNTAMSVEFLMAQMEHREAVAAARENSDGKALDKLRQTLDNEMTLAHMKLVDLIDQQADYSAALKLVRQLMFKKKLISEIDDALEAVVD